MSDQQPAPNEVKIALIQSPSVLGDIPTNTARFERQCRKAALEGAKILVLPEAAITGYLSDDLRTNWAIEGRPLSEMFPQTKELTAEFAEPLNGPSVRHFARLAQELQCYITVPFIEIKDGSFFNSVSLVGPSSDISLAHYQKNCPWPVPEKSWATPGEGVDGAIFDTEYGRVGMAICFDIHTILKKYHDRGLWALLYPIAWVGSVQSWFLKTLPGRLKEVGVPFHILGANWATFAPPSWSGAGQSTAYGPCGELIASTLDECVWREEIVYATIPIQAAALPCPTFDATAYGRWTDDQINTDFWTRGPGARWQLPEPPASD